MTAPKPISHTTAALHTASPEDGERLFLQHLQAIDRIIAIIARRNALSGPDADDFAAWARARLTDAEYSILRKFGGRSSLPTYLSVVLGNLFRDYRNSLWGRWRPSAAAVRMGPIGVRLEELLVRDACPLREAIGILRSSGARETEAELRRLASRLPSRPADREVALETIGDVAGDAAPSRVHTTEELARIEAALLRAIERLDANDRLITKLRFWDGVSVADIARMLDLEQKPLYRRIESIQRTLRASLLALGVTEEDARDLLSERG